MQCNFTALITPERIIPLTPARFAGFAHAERAHANAIAAELECFELAARPQTLTLARAIPSPFTARAGVAIVRKQCLPVLNILEEGTIRFARFQNRSQAPQRAEIAHVRLAASRPGNCQRAAAAVTWGR